MQQTNIGIKREKELLEIKNEELIKLLKQKDKEIERLKEENNFLKLNNPQMNLEHFRVVKENKRKIDNLRLANKRLNNIINELEKEFDDVIKDPLIHMCYKRLARRYADKLQELKGDDK